MNELHSLLKRQLRRYKKEENPSLNNQHDLMQVINETYWQFDADRRMLEHSLELTSQELLERNVELTRINIQLEKRIEERTSSLQSSLNFMYALNQVAQSVLASEDLQHVLKSIVDVVPRTISADRATLILFDHEEKQVTDIVSAGPGAKQIVESVSYDELMEGLTGWAMRELKPAFSPNDNPDPRESPAAQKRRAETNCGCILVLPLSHMGEAFGTMTVINRPEQPDFTQQETTWLEIIATQAATAIGRTQIYEQLKRANLLMEKQGERLKQELTDRQHAEAAVEKSETLFRALFDLSPDAVLVIDPHDPKVSWPIIDCNLATCQMNGYKRDELVGQSIDILNLSTGTPADRIAYMQQLRNEGNIKLETHHRRKNGVVFPVEVSTTLIEIGDRELIIGIDRDITDRKRTEEVLHLQNDMLSSLHQITLGLLKHRNVDELLNSLVESSAIFFGTSFVEIMLAEEDALVVKAVTKNQSGLIGRRMARDEAMLSWQAFEAHEPVILNDYASWQQHQTVYDEFALHAVAGFPIMNDEQCLGVLGLGRDKPGNEFTPDQIQFGRLFANLTGLVLANVQLREALHEQSVHDPLTGLHNRRYMEEAFKQHISRVTRNLHTLGIIMIDIDHFKSFNDTHGHPAGDALLREVGKFLQGHLRVEDVVCRYGGEEFVLIMPDALLESVQQRAEQLRQGVKNLDVQYQGKSLGAISFSLGVAIYPEHGSTQESVLRAADDALYRAKQGGRDRVMLAERENK